MEQGSGGGELVSPQAGSKKASLGVFRVIVMYHVAHWSNVIQILGEQDSVFLLSVKSLSQTFPVDVLISRIFPFILVTHAQMLPIEGLSAGPSGSKDHSSMNDPCSQLMALVNQPSLDTPASNQDVRMLNDLPQ